MIKNKLVFVALTREQRKYIALLLRNDHVKNGTDNRALQYSMMNAK